MSTPNKSSGIKLALVQTSKEKFPYTGKWVEQNAELELVQCKDLESEELVRADFPSFLPTYASLPIPVEKADLFRYLAVYKHGGVYADIDVDPLIPISKWTSTFEWEEGKDGFTHQNLLVVGIEFPRESQGLPIQLVQWCFAATAENHPILLRVAEEVQERVVKYPFKKENFTDLVIKRTGPGAWTAAILDYVQKHCVDKAKRGVDDKGYPKCMIPISDIQKKGQFIELVGPSDNHNGNDERWHILILPYRAFGFHPWHGDEVVKEPLNQHLVHHQFVGSWRE